MRTGTTLVLVLGLLLSTGAAQAATRSADPRWQHVEDDGDDFCDPEFFDNYVAFSLNDDLAPEVDDIVTMTYILNILPFGGLWAPLVLLDKPRPKFSGDIALSYLMMPLITGVITAFTGIGIILWCPAYFWIGPTAALNAWDRAYKCGGSDSGSAPKSKKKKGDSAPPPKKSDGGDEAYGY
jgi:hypothetical protein